MAAMRSSASIRRLHQLGKVFGLETPEGPRHLDSAPLRLFQTRSDEGKLTAEQVTQKAKEVTEKAKDVANEVTEKAKDVANKVSETAKDLGGRVKEKAQGAWESTKEGTQNTKVGEKVQEAENVKDTIVEKVKDKTQTENITGEVVKNVKEKTTEEVIMKTTDIAADATIGKVPKKIIQEGYKIIKDSVNENQKKK